MSAVAFELTHGKYEKMKRLNNALYGVRHEFLHQSNFPHDVMGNVPVRWTEARHNSDNTNQLMSLAPAERQPTGKLLFPSVSSGSSRNTRIRQPCRSKVLSSGRQRGSWNTCENGTCVEEYLSKLTDG